MSSVDVIVPCYKYGRYLRQCVESVLSQEGVDVRVLILDDASPDDTPEVAAGLARDPRVEYRRHSVNRGHIATYNEGLEWASGDYVLLLSADDLLTRGALERATRLMDTHRNVGLCYGQQIVVRGDDELPPTPAQESDCRRRIYAGAEFIHLICQMGNPVTTPSAVVRTSVHHMAGGYKHELPHAGDMELWLRCASRADVAVLDAQQAYKRMHDENMQNAFVSGVIGDLRDRRAALDLFFSTAGRDLANRDSLQALAYQTLAEEAFWSAHSAFDALKTDRCEVVLEFAATVWPAITARPEWGRLRWKRRIGPRVWATVRPWVDTMLANKRARPPVPAPTE